MDAFKRAYRDPKSPLTPITPLANNHSYNFDTSIKPVSTPTSALIPEYNISASLFPKYSQKYAVVHEGIETKRKQCVTPVKSGQKFSTCQRTAVTETYDGGNHYRFRRIPPTQPAQFDSRVGILLARANLSKYKPIFEKEEIDLAVFGHLTEDDLKQLGIQSKSEIRNFKKVQDWFNRNSR